MIELLDRNHKTVGYLDGDDCKDLNGKILGHIVRDTANPGKSYIQDTKHDTYGHLDGDEFYGKDGTSFGRVQGNDLIDSYENKTIGHVKANDPKDTKDRGRAGAVLFWFFDLRA